MKYIIYLLLYNYGSHRRHLRFFENGQTRISTSKKKKGEISRLIANIMVWFSWDGNKLFYFCVNKMFLCIFEDFFQIEWSVLNLFNIHYKTLTCITFGFGFGFMQHIIFFIIHCFYKCFNVLYVACDSYELQQINYQYTNTSILIVYRKPS